MRQPKTRSPARTVRSLFLTLVGAATLLLPACQGYRGGAIEAGPRASAIRAEDLAATTQMLASDAFGGRPPSGPEADLTVDYLVNAFEEMEIAPAFDGAYTQDFPLVSITAAPDAVLTIAGAQGRETFAYADEMMAWTTRVVETSEIAESELVFVGYGIVAPEYGWNDYAGIDMEGKTAIILVNDPGFATEDAELFGGRAMTYYGRWTYKYEEAARQGAAGAIIVHETAPAAYPWDVVVNSWTGPQFDLLRPDANASRVAIEGWVTRDTADRIFLMGGLNYEQLRDRASQHGFSPVPMDLRASLRVENTISQSASRNVAGIIRGSERPDETVIYTAHWDHLGRGPAIDGDEIYNGAADNAAGVAGLLEIAHRMAADAPPARSVIFLATGAEEQGLLGAYHYAAEPIAPLETTAAVINMDLVLPLGALEDIAVVGIGSSELEDILGEEIAAQGRRISAYANPEQGMYFRSDHFAFIKEGVPALYVHPGSTHVEYGADYVAERKADYVANHYHKPSDETSADWDWSGVVLDLEALYATGRRIADMEGWPAWYEDAPFRAARERSAEARR